MKLYCCFRIYCILCLFWLSGTVVAMAGLPEYDRLITTDATAGVQPLTTLRVPAEFYDTNRMSFNFGNSSGDVTFEFILKGDPAAGGISGYLAVGANSASNLRFEQWNNTGQIGFTQNGVADYVFSPAVPSPTEPTHIAFVWTTVTRTMRLYVNGSVAGTRTGVSTGFSMPRAAGYFGNNGANTDGMVGTIYRVTVYDDALASEVIQRHADAFTGVTRPPILLAFTAAPDILFSPASTLLSWELLKADSVTLDGSDVTDIGSIFLNPEATHAYELIARNAGGSVTGNVTVVVNPPPRINRFEPDRRFVGSSDPVLLSWDIDYGDEFSITPGVGSVTSRTVEGRGSVEVFPTSDTTYTLTGELHGLARGVTA